MKRDERGYIVVETIGSFLLFVFLMASILCLVNVVTVQARIHYAITQAAETVSMYSYVLDATGVSGHLINSAQKAEKVKADAKTLSENVNTVLDNIEALNIEGISESGKTLYDQGSSMVNSVKNDPKAVLQDFINYGVNEVGSAAFAKTVLEPLVERYLANGQMSGDEFLKTFHVIGGMEGLEFNSDKLMGFDSESNRLTSVNGQNSNLFTGDGDVRVVVNYSIDYTFGALPLPFSELKITQSVLTKAWLSGEGEGYVWQQ